MALISDIVVVAMIASIAPTLMGLASLLASIKNGGKLNTIHTEINSRLTSLLEETKNAAHAAGRQFQRDETPAAPQPAPASKTKK